MKIKSPFLTKKIVIPLLLIVMTILYLVDGLSLSAPVVDGVLTETFFPTLAGGISLLACTILLVKEIIVANRNKDNATERELKVPVKALILMGVMILFVAFFETLGYVIIAPIFVFSFMVVYDDKPQHLLKKLIFSIIICALVFVLYEFFFDIRFPEIWS